MEDRVYDVGDSLFTIAPDFGCNLHKWQLAGEDILYCPAGFPASGAAPFAGGNPVLYPAVGRTWDRSEATAVADQYKLHEHDTPLMMPCHGIVALGSWTLLDENVTAAETTVGFQFEIAEEARAGRYPFDIRFSLTYILRPNAVTMRAHFQNVGGTAAPVAYGLHPYFSISRKTDIAIDLPCDTRVVLDAELLIPIGAEPLPDNVLNFGDSEGCDAGYSGAPGGTAQLRDTGAGRSVTIRTDNRIDTWVVYADTNNDFVCIEPWTPGLGGYADLGTEGWQRRQKVPVLAPSEEVDVEITYEVTNL